MGFVDIHSHILPGLDDGPSCMEDSIKMAKVACSEDTSVIVATPHDRDVSARFSSYKVISLANTLNNILLEQSIPIKVLVGMENHLAMDSPEQFDKGIALPIEGTCSMLIEFPFEFVPWYAEDIMGKLQRRGLQLIIVHPERNAWIQKNFGILSRMVDMGVLCQITAGSITGEFGPLVQRTSDLLLRRGLVHIVASDSHSYKGNRSPILSDAVDYIGRIIGPRTANRMAYDIPYSIINNLYPEMATI